jgi:uncharacterized protein
VTVFVDTSALYALLSADDPMHRRAATFLPTLRATALVTHNYVVVEATALVQRQLGSEGANALFELLAPVDLVWIDEPIHRAAMAAFLQRGEGDLSLVDCASFEVMRLRHIRAAFAFDQDFATAGYDLPA